MIFVLCLNTLYSRAISIWSENVSRTMKRNRSPRCFSSCGHPFQKPSISGEIGKLPDDLVKEGGLVAQSSIQSRDNEIIIKIIKINLLRMVFSCFS
jgi:hypothetical protein